MVPNVIRQLANATALRDGRGLHVTLVLIRSNDKRNSPACPNVIQNVRPEHLEETVRENAFVPMKLFVTDSQGSAVVYQVGLVNIATRVIKE